MKGNATRRAAGKSSFLEMPGYLLRRCQQIAVAVFLDECRPFELTPLQYGMLSALDGFGPMEQARLGGIMALDRTTIIVVLTKLAERGLVTRMPSQKDRRAKIVAITDAGRRTVKEVLPLVLKAQDSMLGPLNESERKDLLVLLTKMAEGNNRLSRAPQRMP